MGHLRHLLRFLVLGLAFPHDIIAQQARLDTIAFQTHEGTALSLDLSRDGRSIVFDLLGQLWLVPRSGGQARQLTDAVRDTADDADPSFSPDGRRIVFRGERRGRTGLWLLELESGAIRQLTQLADPNGYEGGAAWSPDGNAIAFARLMPVDSTRRRHTAIVLYDLRAGTERAVVINGVPNLRDPAWTPDGDRIVLVAAHAARDQASGRLWVVRPSSGEATALGGDSINVLAPAFSPDGGMLAYFAPDSAKRMQVWVAQAAPGALTGTPHRLTSHRDVTATRVRWTGDGRSLLYAADGRMWTVAAAGGSPREIPFTAAVRFARTRVPVPPAHFAAPGERLPARGFTGLALSPDAQSIGMLALGKLWLIPVSGAPRAVTDVPSTARHLAWSPDGSEVTWSAGPWDDEDLFTTTVASGVTRQRTALPGREMLPAFSPDGRRLLFVHAGQESHLRMVEAGAAIIRDTAETVDLGPVSAEWSGSNAIAPQWNPTSDGVLIGDSPANAALVRLDGRRSSISRFPDSPIFLQWVGPGLLYVRHDRLWQAQFDSTGLLTPPEPLGDRPALYASAARDGTLLFVSDSGLKLRSPGGRERQIGWPVPYTVPVAEPVLLRNVRLIDGTGKPPTPPSDLLIERGRISRIAHAGTIPTARRRVIDAEGRVAIPGLMDLHAHEYRLDLMPGYPYFGVTTIRDQGSSIAPLVASADAVAAGVVPGPRVAYGGFQFYSDWAYDEEQGRGVEPEADPGHLARAVALAKSFGAQHIKTRTFRRWDINARFIAEAHRLGMRASGHCAQQLPLVAAGMDAKEHINLCATRGEHGLYDDMIQLYRTAGIAVNPTLSYFALAPSLSARPTLLEEDAELVPFLPPKDNFGWMLELTEDDRVIAARVIAEQRAMTLKLLRSGVTLATGSDIWQIPTGVHMELEELVVAGLTPLEAIHAATGAAAQVLGAEADLGTIAVGKLADIVILDADPLSDIRNTRRIWRVFQNGQLVDREAILASRRPR